MQQKFYRVECEEVDLSKIYNSNENNYGRKLDFQYYKHFLNVYLSVMKTNNISVDFLISLNNQIVNFGKDYLDKLNNAIVNEEFVDIYKVTGNDKHKNQTISIVSINHFIQSFDRENQFIYFENGAYLWEFLNELVRLNYFKDKPNRLDSVFLFSSIESCNYYISEHLNGIGKIYEVELIEVEKYFETDMRVIDNIENQILFEDVINEFSDYWQGKLTENPIKEIIFQGKYNLKIISSNE